MSDSASQISSHAISHSETAQTSMKSDQDHTKTQCEDCLKTSMTKTKEGQMQLDKTRAVEKLDLVKDIAQTQDLKNKIQFLIDQILRTDTAHISNLSEITDIVKQSFQEKVQPIMEAQTGQLTSNMRNPFKPENPFAAKVITKVREAEKPLDKRPHESQQENSDVPWYAFWKKKN